MTIDRTKLELYSLLRQKQDKTVNLQMLEEQAASIAHKITVGGLEVNELDRKITAKRTVLQAELDDQSPVQK